jgi:tetratricopeptide (TPR) repeat protein
LALFVQQGRESEAVKLFEQCAQQQPDSGANYFCLGELLVRLQQLDGTEQAYQKVTELSPEQPEGRRALTGVYLHGNRNLAKVQTLVERVVELQPSAPNFLFAGRRACEESGPRPGLGGDGAGGGAGPGKCRLPTVLRTAQEGAVMRRSEGVVRWGSTLILRRSGLSCRGVFSGGGRVPVLDPTTRRYPLDEHLFHSH